MEHSVGFGIIFALVVAYNISLTAAIDPPTVTISQGTLEGLTLESRNGNKYSAFLGVPYGKVPVRFGLSQPPDSWDGIKKVNTAAPHCYQFCLVNQKLNGIEDCLTLNVFTRKLDGNNPVMLFLHGGGFQTGTHNFHHAKYFMDENIVLVVIQYRLGALGFLNTEDDEVSGNMGLKDQTLALKWVQENIKHFGGDASKVSIFGFSAGGVAVHYHMLSPMSKGLFSSAISQSGSALDPWALQTKPKQLAIRLADNLDCGHETSKQLVECLRSKTPAELVTAQLKLSKYPKEFDAISMLFCPSVEKGKSEPKFLSDTPYNIITQGKVASKVPWMAGVSMEEGAFYIAGIVESNELTEQLDADWDEMAPNILYYENTASKDAQRYVSEKVRKFYFGDGKITPDKYLELGRAFGDRFFNNGMTRSIKEHARKAEFPVYPYIFNYYSSHSVQQGLFKTKKSYGIGHAEELKLQFNEMYAAPEYGLDTIEGKFSEKFNKLFTSFARDGKPTATWGSAKLWEPFHLTGDKENETPIPWYVFDEDTKILKEDPYKIRSDFWESLPLKEWDKADNLDGKDEL